MIYKNDLIYIEKHDSDIPWVKIFAKQECKELSQCDEETKSMLIKTQFVCEELMIEHYKPDKINIASFGNYLPRVHIHVMARFKNDSHFPESMWGEKQREANLELPDFELFEQKLLQKMQDTFA